MGKLRRNRSLDIDDDEVMTEYDVINFMIYYGFMIYHGDAKDRKEAKEIIAAAIKSGRLNPITNRRNGA